MQYGPSPAQTDRALGLAREAAEIARSRRTPLFEIRARLILARALLAGVAPLESEGKASLLVEEAEAKVKAEEDDAVDIDLTLDDDDIDPRPPEKPVETCLICESELAGMSNLVRTSTFEAYVPFNVILGDP